MKIIAIITETSNPHLLVEVTAEEMSKITGVHENSFKHSISKMVGAEYDITSAVETAKMITTLSLGEDYNSILEQQRRLVKTMEKLQKPMGQIKEQFKTVIK